MNAYLSVHNNPINAVDPLGLEAQDGSVWHHQASKGVFDPANATSELNKLKMKLDEGIDIHSKEYGWELSRAEHGTLHSNEFGTKWELEQKAWLKKQNEAGVTTITEGMLKDHLQNMRVKYGLTSPEGARLIGHQAESGWKNVTRYYDELASGGKLIVENVTAPERLSARLAEGISETTWRVLSSTALKRGVRITVVAGAVYLGVSGFNEARADGAPVGASVLIGSFEAVNPLPWSSIQIKNKLGDAANSAAVIGNELGNQRYYEYRARNAGMTVNEYKQLTGER